MEKNKPQFRSLPLHRNQQKHRAHPKEILPHQIERKKLKKKENKILKVILFLTLLLKK